MEIKSYEVESVVILEISGEININTSPDLKKLFEKQANRKIA